MFKYFFCFAIIILTISACSSSKHIKNAMIKQGISGFIYEVKGNQMPMKGEELPKPKGFAAIISIYEITNTNQVVEELNSGFYTAINTKEVATVTADSTGKFSVALPVGSYSLFVKVASKFYANRFNQNNEINVYTVAENKVTEASISFNYAAFY